MTTNATAPRRCSAALNVAEGIVIDACMSRHRHQESIKFLKHIDAATDPKAQLHLVADNYATHKHPKVRRWLRRHPRFHMHFTPTSSSWLNLVERWFRRADPEAFASAARSPASANSSKPSSSTSNFTTIRRKATTGKLCPRKSSPKFAALVPSSIRPQ